MTETEKEEETKDENEKASQQKKLCCGVISELCCVLLQSNRLPHTNASGADSSLRKGLRRMLCHSPGAQPPLCVASPQDHSNRSFVTTDFMDALRLTLRSDATGSLVPENINKQVKPALFQRTETNK